MIDGRKITEQTDSIAERFYLILVATEMDLAWFWFTKESFIRESFVYESN